MIGLVDIYGRYIELVKQQNMVKRNKHFTERAHHWSAIRRPYLYWGLSRGHPESEQKALGMP
jgi:hypothetical protein